VTFSEPIRASTFTVADVRITGPGAVNIQPLGVVALSAIQFRITFPVQFIDGDYVLKSGRRSWISR
jgi:hypothetical protein